MMAGKRRRRSLAYTPAERDAWLRVAYLAHYGDDPDFGRELTTLYAERAEPACPLPFDPTAWWIGATSDRDDVRELYHVTEPVAAYVAAVRALAARYGLARLRVPDDWPWPGISVGQWHVHAWCSWRATEAAHGRQVGPEWFAFGYGLAGPPPDIPEGSFDPRRELYAEARTRLGWRHRAEIEASAEAAEAAGYLFDLSPATRRDIRWLYRRVALGQRFDAIAEGLGDDPEGTGPERVRRAVRRMSRHVLRPGRLSGR